MKLKTLSYSHRITMYKMRLGGALRVTTLNSTHTRITPSLHYVYSLGGELGLVDAATGSLGSASTGHVSCSRASLLAHLYVSFMTQLLRTSLPSFAAACRITNKGSLVNAVLQCSKRQCCTKKVNNQQSWGRSHSWGMELSEWDPRLHLLQGSSELERTFRQCLRAPPSLQRRPWRQDLPGSTWWLSTTALHTRSVPQKQSATISAYELKMYKLQRLCTQEMCLGNNLQLSLCTSWKCKWNDGKAVNDNVKMCKSLQFIRTNSSRLLTSTSNDWTRAQWKNCNPWAFECGGMWI